MYRILSIIVWVSFLLFVTLVPGFFYAISVDAEGLFGGMPDFEMLENPENDLASELWSADGVLLGKYYRQNRSQVSYEHLSPKLVNTLIASEDIRFYEHPGIDPQGIAAIPYYLIKGRKRGSSTITQQLAKNLFKMRGDHFEGSLAAIHPIINLALVKFKEWIIAVRLERAYAKKEILTMYLNTVDFGSNSFGIKVAAKTFFSIQPDSLNYSQSAILIGLLQAPTYYSPIRNPENSLVVRNKVLSQLLKYDYLDRADYDSLVLRPIDISEYEVENHNKGIATYFRAEVKKWLMRWGKANDIDIFEDGVRVFTTIDSRMQVHAETAMKNHMTMLQKEFFKEWNGENPWVTEVDDNRYEEMEGFFENAVQKTPRFKSLLEEHEDTAKVWELMAIPDTMRIFSWYAENNETDTVMSSLDSIRYYKNILHSGMMSMDPMTGYIKAWVGGINHKYFKYDHVQQGRRQPGSTFKPIVYATAIEDKNFSPCYEVADVPIAFPMNDEENSVWTPKNSSGTYSGKTYTLRQALAQSINTVAAYLIKAVTPRRVVDYAHDKFGIKSKLPAAPALALGTADVSVYELVGAYGAFVNHGTYTQPIFITHIEDKHGKVLYQGIPNTVEALSEETAYVMTYMLRGSSEETGGTSMGLWRYDFRKDNEVGGKTGTTANYSDGWYVGITKDLVTGVWVGCEDRSVHFKTIHWGQGARMAMPIFAEYTDSVFKDQSLNYTKGPFNKPASAITTKLDCGDYDDSKSTSDSLRMDMIDIPTDIEDGIF